MNSRPSIPSDVRLILRQESGFGCCKCGNPIIQYHHIIPWEVENHNRPEDMMCLCPTHHAEVRVISEKEQREIKLNPLNKQNNKVEGYLHISSTVPIIKLGGNTFKKQGVILKIDTESIVSLNSDTVGNLTLSVKLWDEQGQNVLTISDNEWESGDYLAWDIEYKLNFLKLRYKKGDIGFQIDARKTPMDLMGNFWFQKQNFLLEPSRILFNGVIKNTTFSNCEFVNTFIHVDLEEKSLKISSDKSPTINLDKGKIEFGKDGPSISGDGTISGSGSISTN